ncbi:MAG: hypothetical protein Q4A62_06190 [Eikenella sp.]|nr:hypothetical protein [Eikenella sp.]
MKLRLFALSALLTSSVLSASPLAAGYVYGSDHCYGFEAPAGWRMDNRLLARHGVGMAFLPLQEGVLPGVLLYTRSAARTDGMSSEEAIKNQVNDVLAMYAADGTRIRAERLRTVAARNGVRGELWRFYGHANGREERAVYFPAERTVNFFVAQIPDSKWTADAEAALIKLAVSYHERASCRPCQVEGSCVPVK